jgi:hypothetical protein
VRCCEPFILAAETHLDVGFGVTLEAALVSRMHNLGLLALIGLALLLVYVLDRMAGGLV